MGAHKVLLQLHKMLCSNSKTPAIVN